MLSLVPVAIYTDGDGNVNKSPILVYHEDGDNFDADTTTLVFDPTFKPTRRGEAIS